MNKIICGIVLIFLFLSCENKKPRTEEIKQIVEEDETSILIETLIKKDIPFIGEIENPNEIMRLMYSAEEGRFRNSLPEIVFIKKANFGIPGGNNFVVIWRVPDNRSSNNQLFIYSISNIIEHRFSLGSGIINPNEKTSFDIMENIPGIHIPETGLSIYDINGDGIVELVGYNFTGLGDWIEIRAYSAEENKMVDLCNIRFEIVDMDNGPAPMEFVNYKGIDGFKVFVRYTPYYEDFPPPMNLINNVYAWFFCSWNNNKYDVIEEYLIDQTLQEFNINIYPEDFFRIKIQDFLSNTSGLRSFQEIDPRVEGGRSFLTIVYYGPTATESEEIFDFDHNGKMVYKK